MTMDRLRNLAATGRSNISTKQLQSHIKLEMTKLDVRAGGFHIDILPAAIEPSSYLVLHLTIRKQAIDSISQILEENAESLRSCDLFWPEERLICDDITSIPNLPRSLKSLT